MITRPIYKLTHRDIPGAAIHGSQGDCERWRDNMVAGGARFTLWYLAVASAPKDMSETAFKIEPAPRCQCCGEFMIWKHNDSLTTWENGQTRCARHHDRNPCAIEGCKRTTAAPIGARGHAIIDADRWLCGEHWRKYVPPRSRLRRAYHAHFKRAKRNRSPSNPEGWTPRLNRKFWRFWTYIVAQARRRHEGGFIDEAEIARLMGWDVAEPV